MPYKLLLADDSVTIQRVIELTFADEDIQVITVSDGRQAIERIQMERPDIVLADVGMPERDGYEVAAFIKSDPELSGIPVLLLTGAFEPVDEERARAAGCDGVLAKPFEPQMVITRVKELLAGTTQRTPRPAANPSVFVSADTVARAWPEPRAESSTRAETPPVGVAGHELDEPLAEEAAPPPSPADSVRIKRRPPIPVPPPASEPAEGLDDYFDRLDAAFATLNRVSTPSEPSPAARASIRPAGKPALSDYPSTTADSSEHEEERHFDAYGSPPSLPRPAPQGQPRSNFDAPVDFGADQSTARFTQPAVADPGAASDPVHSPVMAQAFSALLAAERGDPAPPLAAITLGSAAVSDEFIEQVVQRILARMTDRVVRETVADIVSNVAERMVRTEIDRVKASLK